MDLLALAEFNLVARHGGFGRAARAAGRRKATLSRRLAELEAGFNLQLFERSAHDLNLTEEGCTLHVRAGVEGRTVIYGSAPRCCSRRRQWEGSPPASRWSIPRYGWRSLPTTARST